MVRNPRDNHYFLNPPFYIALELQDLHLHNILYDSRASHSLVPFIMMEKMNLDITRPYIDLYLFQSKRVQCLGMVKDLVVSIVQIPQKHVMMDLVIINVPPTYGMFLSRQW